MFEGIPRFRLSDVNARLLALQEQRNSILTNTPFFRIPESFMAKEVPVDVYNSGDQVDPDKSFGERLLAQNKLSKLNVREIKKKSFDFELLASGSFLRPTTLEAIRRTTQKDIDSIFSERAQTRFEIQSLRMGVDLTRYEFESIEAPASYFQFNYEKEKQPLWKGRYDLYNRRKNPINLFGFAAADRMRINDSLAVRRSKSLIPKGVSTLKPKEDFIVRTAPLIEINYRRISNSLQKFLPTPKIFDPTVASFVPETSVFLPRDVSFFTTNKAAEITFNDIKVDPYTQFEIFDPESEIGTTKVSDYLVYSELQGDAYVDPAPKFFVPNSSHLKVFYNDLIINKLLYEGGVHTHAKESAATQELAEIDHGAPAQAIRYMERKFGEDGAFSQIFENYLGYATRISKQLQGNFNETKSNRGGVVLTSLAESLGRQLLDFNLKRTLLQLDVTNIRAELAGSRRPGKSSYYRTSVRAGLTDNQKILNDLIVEEDLRTDMKAILAKKEKMPNHLIEIEQTILNLNAYRTNLAMKLAKLESELYEKENILEQQDSLLAKLTDTLDRVKSEERELKIKDLFEQESLEERLKQYGESFIGYVNSVKKAQAPVIKDLAKEDFITEARLVELEAKPVKFKLNKMRTKIMSERKEALNQDILEDRQEEIVENQVKEEILTKEARDHLAKSSEFLAMNSFGSLNFKTLSSTSSDCVKSLSAAKKENLYKTVVTVATDHDPGRFA